MGRLLDPDNPLFHGAASSKAVGGGAVRTGPTNNAPSISAAATASAKAPPQIGTFEPNRAGNAAPDLVPSVSLADIRLPEEPIPPTPKGEVQDLDFDIGTKIASPGAALDEAEAKAQQTGDIDFDLDAVTLIPQDYDKPGDDAAFVETDVQANQPVLEDDAVEFDVSLTESTVLGHQPPEPASSFDMASIDLDLQSPELEIADIEDPSPAASVAKAPAEREARQDTLVSTAINPNLSTAHMETVITPPEPVPQNQSDTAPNLDFAVEPMETQGIPNEPAQTEAVFNFEPADQHAGTVVTAQPGAAEQEPAPEPDTGASEEIATKLDLAKAYEDMGDIEGARELLQEILKEGNASQRETAKSALARLGG
jgi:pilus assembly protein FimV